MNKKILFTFIFAFIFLFLSYLPNIYEASVINKLPADRTMIWGEHIYTYDYNVYLSKILQGTEGRWTIVDKYDNNTHQNGVFLQMFYLLSGKIGTIFGLSPILIYQLIRTITSVLWVLTIIYLNFYFLKKPKKAILGIILSLLAASFPIFSKMGPQFWIRSYMAWWQEMDVVKRISFIPHDTVNYIMIALLFLLFGKYLKSKNQQYFYYITGLLFISVFIHPTAAILFLISWFLYWVMSLRGTSSDSRGGCGNPVIKLFILIIAAFIPLLYIKLITSSYPWKALTDFDQYHRLPFSIIEYLLALGPIVICGIAGIILAIVKKDNKMLILASWFLGALSAMLIFQFFPLQSGLRFVQTANQIPLAILTVYLVDYFIKKYQQRLVKIIIYLVMAIIIIIGIVQAYYSLKGQLMFIHQRAVATLPLVPYPSQVMYPLTDFYQALQWLENNTRHEQIVLSQLTAGNYIPAYAGNFVFLGHQGETPHFDQRWQQVMNFYSGTMIDAAAYQFLKQENIVYVFYGPQEKENTKNDINRYPFLKPVFERPYVTIYQVTKY